MVPRVTAFRGSVEGRPGFRLRRPGRLDAAVRQEAGDDPRGPFRRGQRIRLREGLGEGARLPWRELRLPVGGVASRCAILPIVSTTGPRCQDAKSGSSRQAAGAG
jgi:hypothetical protein